MASKKSVFYRTADFVLDNRPYFLSK